MTVIEIAFKGVGWEYLIAYCCSFGKGMDVRGDLYCRRARSLQDSKAPKKIV